ncbi:galactokinase [Rhodocaloribacter litoris]|uniref:galactokinase n=1 Tax=Rhodocaloribacter litoris TaxID=2558931 RepID=UPI00142084E0|nr:galactokinase [Rhodocaloribacter litoris]QXD15443.1 galactokinase [Rhodocaloribacter litoris]
MTTRKPLSGETRAPTTAVAPVDRVRRAFERYVGPAAEATLALAPGRVNLIGDHTDYNDGFVLPMTLGQAVYVALRRRPDRRIVLHALNYDERLEATLDALPGPGSSWRHYAGGVVALLQERGFIPSGFEGVLYGDVPVGAGLSSSAATEVALLVGLEHLFGFALEGAEGARLCQQVEHRFIGVQCGIMDQFAARLGRAGHALFLDCRTLAFEAVPVHPGEHVFVIADSRAPRSLAASKYNERRAECEAGVAFFQRLYPQVRALRDVSAEMLEAHAAALPEPVRRRCRHVVGENARVQEAVAALRAGDLARFGTLMTASHASLRDLYEVSSPELDRLVETACATDGVRGARMTGAGFGGCTVILAHRDAVPDLTQRLSADYRTDFGRTPAVYVVERNLEAGPVSFSS